MSELRALALFSLVAAITPGPNNVMLWASGIQFGVRRTVPHALGIVLGVGSMAIMAAAGLAALIEAAPMAETSLKVIGSAYLLYLAYQISGASGSERTVVAQPLRLSQGLVFQYVNPKAWVFVLGAISVFRPNGLSIFVTTALTAATIMVVVFPSTLIWTAAGSVLNRFFTSRRWSRALGIVLGALLASTVIFIWT